MKAEEAYKRALLENVLLNGMSTLGFTNLINQPLHFDDPHADRDVVLLEFMKLSNGLECFTRQYDGFCWSITGKTHRR